MKNLIQKLCITGFSSIAVLAFSQTEKEKNNMKSQTDTIALKKLSEFFEKKKVSKEELQKKAKQLGIPYSGKGENGSYFELQGFEDNGNPIYYTTYQSPNSPTITQPREKLLEENTISTPKVESKQPKIQPQKQEKSCRKERKNKK